MVDSQRILLAILFVASLPAAYAFLDAIVYAFRSRHKRRAISAGYRKRNIN